MNDEKDRMGEKLREVEKAREDQWAWEQDRKLIEQLRAKHGTQLLCPRCHQPLVAGSRAGLAIAVCPDDEGVWVDSATFKTLVEKLG